MDRDACIDWTRTRGALDKLVSLFNCYSCHNSLVEPCCFQMCDHHFCHRCAMDLVNNGANCPACGAVLWREHLQVSLKIPEVMKICERIQTLISCENRDTLRKTGADAVAVEASLTKMSRSMDDDTNTYVFNYPENSETVSSIADDQTGTIDIVEVHDSEDFRVDSKKKQKVDELSEEISINVTPEYSHEGLSQQCHITQPDPVELIQGAAASPATPTPSLVVLDAQQLANTEICFDNSDDKVVRSKVSRSNITEMTFNDVSDGDILPFPLSNDSNKENSSLIVDPSNALELVDDGQCVFDFSSGTITKTIKFKSANPRATGPKTDTANIAERDRNGMTSIKSKRNSKEIAKGIVEKKGTKNVISSTTEIPLSPSPIKSQFTNAVSDRDCANGAQRNPSTFTKKPKFTYGNKKKVTVNNAAHANIEAKKATKKTMSTGVDESVFDFSSGTCTKTIQFQKKDAPVHESSDEEEALITIANKTGKRKRATSISHPEPVPDDESSDKENKKRSKRNPRKQAAHKTNIPKPAPPKTRNLEKKNKKGETPLHTASIKGNINRVQELLKEGALANTKDFNGWTPLHEACNYGHTKVVELLLDHGAIIDCVAGEDNDTPLHDAVANGRVEVVCVLLRRGAPQNIKNKEGKVPRDYATTAEMKNVFNVFETSDVSVSDSRLDVSTVSVVCDVRAFVTTNLNPMETSQVANCCQQLGATLLDEFDTTVTHVICGTSDDMLSKTRTMKYLLGVLSGKWLVSLGWIRDSCAAGKWLSEVSYEVHGAVGTSSVDVPMISRVNAFKCLPKLFEGCSFYMSGVFSGKSTKQTVMNLITEGGGKILYREPKITDLERCSIVVPSKSRGKKSKDQIPVNIAPVRIFHARDNSAQVCCSEYILYDPQLSPGHKKVCSPHLCTAPLPWLYDCISNFQIVNVEDAYEQLEGYKSSQE